MLALVVSVLPGLEDVRERFGQAEPGWIAVMFACVLASTLSYVAALRGTLSRQIGWRASWNLGMAEQGSNVLLPTGGVGGPALGASSCAAPACPTGVAAPRSAALFLLTSATSFAAIALAGTATGLGLLPGDVSWVGTLLPAALAVALMTAVAALGRLPVGRAAEARASSRAGRRRIGALLRDGVQRERRAPARPRPARHRRLHRLPRASPSPRSAPRSRPSAAAGRRSARSSSPTRSARSAR